MGPLIVVLVILIIVLLIPFLMYNTLVGKRNQIQNIFGTMDALLKKRWDLVPNLVATVKGYADHERQLFEKVTEMRAKFAAGEASFDQWDQYVSTMERMGLRELEDIISKVMFGS